MRGRKHVFYHGSISLFERFHHIHMLVEKVTLRPKRVDSNSLQCTRHVSATPTLLNLYPPAKETYTETILPTHLPVPPT